MFERIGPRHSAAILTPATPSEWTVFGRHRQNFQEIVRCFPIATRFPDRIGFPATDAFRKWNSSHSRNAMSGKNGPPYQFARHRIYQHVISTCWMYTSCRVTSPIFRRQPARLIACGRLCCGRSREALRPSRSEFLPRLRYRQSRQKPASHVMTSFNSPTGAG
jgi:hypothetical protein